MPDDTDITAWFAWLADMLAHKTGEVVWVGALTNGEIHIVHQAVRADHPVQLLDADTAIPWHACALGHAIVASLDTDAREALLARPAQRLTGLTVTDPGKLRQALAVTRLRGYAVEAHAGTLGEAGIAAPVFDAEGRAIGAVGIVGPVERLLTAGRLEGLAEAVRLTGQALSQYTGHATESGMWATYGIQG
jgi:DNA-binding IclR family transcriptional regulator